MPLLSRLSSLWRNLFRRSDVERELDEELESYLDLRAAEEAQDSLSSQEARRRALAEIGGKETLKERIRERRIGHRLDSFVQDLLYGIRLIGRYPGFTLLAVSTLGLGIAASTAVYSVVDGVLIESLPYPDPSRLVFIGTNAPNGRRHFSPPDFVDFQRASTSFEGLAAIQGQSLVTLSVDGQPEPVRMRDVTTNFLSVYGVEPFIGRAFAPTDDAVVAFEDWGNPEVALPTSVIMISHELWKERFGGNPAVLGKLVELDYQPYQIIGVTPPGFETLIPDEGDYRSRVDVWSLSRMDFPRMPRDTAFLRVVGRLKSGVTVSQAQAEALLFAERQRRLYTFHRETGYELEVVSLHRSLTSHHAASIWLLFGSVGFLLFIACANLANLLLTRSVARQKELAIRMALGSGRARLVRQLLAESALLAILGLCLGVSIAHWLVRVFVRLGPASIPRIGDIGVDGPVFTFALALSLITTMLAALFPAIRFSRPRETAALRLAGRAMVGTGRQVWDRVIVVCEVALSVILVIGTALFLRSLVALLEVDPGFQPERVLTAEMNLPSRRYPRYPRPDERIRFARRVTKRISALPGVDDVGLALVVPLSRQDAGHTYASEDMVASNLVLPPAKYRPVTPGYFRAVGTRLLAGRSFTWEDVEQYRLVSIVDERLARRTWPGQHALGERLRVEVWSTAGGEIHLEPLWTQVVGIAENVRSSKLGEEDLETVYLPYGLYAVSELSLMVRSSTEPSMLTDPVRREVSQVDPDLALFNFRVMDDFVADSVAPERFSLDLLSAFGATGFALAIIGLYGVLSHSVSLRMKEIGVRMALGARSADVLRLVMARGINLILAGLAIGLLGASGLSRFIESQLYQVSPVDWTVYSAVAMLVLVVSLAACYLPARRASRIDPTRTLHLEG